MICYSVKFFSKSVISRNPFWPVKFLFITNESGENKNSFILVNFLSKKNYPKKPITVHNKGLYSTCFYLGQNAASVVKSLRRRNMFLKNNN